MMKFCTAINCMDGRVQLPVIKFLQWRFNAEYVDMISEPGPNLILAKQNNTQLVESIMARVDISVNKHGSVGLAVVGHYDCAGNPATKEEQITQVNEAIKHLRTTYHDLEMIALWVDEHWNVHEIVEE